MKNITQEADELRQLIIKTLIDDTRNLEDLGSILSWATLQHSKTVKLANNPILEEEQEFYDNIDGDINNIKAFLFHEECGDR